MNGTSDAQRVLQKISDTLRTMAAVYRGTEYKTEAKENNWSDGENASGLINTCEGLECFLIPCLRIPDLTSELLDGNLLPLDEIKAAVKRVTSYDKLVGEPYVDFRIKGDSGAVGSGLDEDLVLGKF